MPSLPPVAEMERAYQSRDASYDGIFFLGVHTTGVFCRPSCPARKPLPRNVAYFATAQEALTAGFRPCKRCAPLDIQGVPPAWLQPLVQELEQDPTIRLTDADLRGRGLDPVRVRRHFLRTTGTTFQAYCRARRLGQALTELRAGAKLDEAALGNGYESHSGFREAFGKTFGRAPGRARTVDCIHLTQVPTPLGPIVLAATQDGLCLAEFANEPRLKQQLVVLERLFRCALVPGTNPHLEQAGDEVQRYFAGALFTFTVSLVAPGSMFQQAVWAQVRRIPAGETRSYGAVARTLGSGQASRAVGAANGRNRIAIFIPCHRVVRGDGQPGGYGGGLWRKQALLDHERKH